MAFSPRARVLIIAALLFAALAALIWFLSARYWAQPVTPLPPPDAAVEAVTPRPATPTVTPAAGTPAQTTPDAGIPAPDASATPASSPDGQVSPQPSATPAAGSIGGRLLIPVAGVGPDQLRDTYNEARSEGRVHNAIDIIAPRGTPVFAADDGRIVKLFESEKGGITLYQLGADERTVYYYAHLDRYADGLQEGRYARRGETIAYVGDTGNVTPGNCHLHFQVYRITDPKHFYNGENLNPYTLLR